jgi:hypothetical protein
MDSSSSSSSAHASMLMPGFSSLPSQDQLAVLQQIPLHDKPTLRSIASTNRHINVLATPLLVEAYIGHVEKQVKTMKTSAEKVAAISLIQQKLVDNADRLPIMGSATLWERLKVLVLGEASCLTVLSELHEGIEATITFPQPKEISVECMIALQRSIALYGEISGILTKAIKDTSTQLRRTVIDS